MTNYDKGTVAIVGAILIFGVACLWWGIHYGLADNDAQPYDEWHADVTVYPCVPETLRPCSFVKPGGILGSDLVMLLRPNTERDTIHFRLNNGAELSDDLWYMMREALAAGRVGAAPPASAPVGAVWFERPEKAQVWLGDRWVTIWFWQGE